MFCTVRENHICGAIKLTYIFGILVYTCKRRKNILGDTRDDSRAYPTSVFNLRFVINNVSLTYL